MKISIRKIFVLLAIVMSLVAVPAAQAVIVEGTVTAIDGCNTVTLSSGDIVSSLGPKAYWRSEGMTSYPKVDDYLCIDAYDGLDKLVAVKVCYDSCDTGNCIELRDPVTLIPLWIGFPTTETSALSTTVTATTDCDCDNCHIDCPDNCSDCTCELLCECICDGDGPYGPKGSKK
jgi:hypothetical protein